MIEKEASISTVELPCVRYGDSVFIFEQSSIHRIELPNLCTPTESQEDVVENIFLKDDPWGKAFIDLAKSLNYRSKCSEHRKADHWGRWADTRSKSIQKRNIRLSNPKKRSQFTSASRPDWNTAGRKMLQSLYSRVKRAREDAWIKWSNTVSKNMNRREKRRCS